jgi:hypothetical protein
MTPSTSLTIGLITLATALPAAAQAQLVGTYNGTQANGAPISLTVTQPKKTLDLSGLGVGITTTCPDAEKIPVSASSQCRSRSRNSPSNCWPIRSFTSKPS